ncbi:hypothetical protein D9M69_425500 [compost metagenome]
MRQAVAKRGFGLLDAPLAQIRHAEHPFTESTDGIELWRPEVVGGPLVDPPRLLGLPLEQQEYGDLVGEHGLQLDRAGRQLFHPRRGDSQRLVRAVGKVIGRGGDGRCFPAHVLVGGRVLLDTVHQAQRLHMPLAQRKNPRGGHAHPRARLHLLGGKFVEPVLNPAELPTYRDLVQAAFDISISLLRLAGLQELARSLLKECVFLEPVGRPFMQQLAVLGRQTSKACLEKLPRQGMDAHPVAVEPLGKNWRRRAQAAQQLIRALIAGERRAQRWMDHVQQ